MKLIVHIEESHGGRKDKFAASMKVSPQQVSRWLKYDCIWFEGAVWKQQSKPANLAATNKDTKS